MQDVSVHTIEPSPLCIKRLEISGNAMCDEYIHYHSYNLHVSESIRILENIFPM